MRLPFTIRSTFFPSRHVFTKQQPHNLYYSPRRLLSSQPPSPTPPPNNPRLNRLLNTRLFRPLNTRILSPLRHAPISTITSFLILHELTAIIPLFLLAGVFHYTQWLPPYFSEGVWVVKGVEMFGRWFRRKGWISEGEERAAERRVKDGNAEGMEIRGAREKVGKWFGRGEMGTRVVVEFATAWAVVKVLLPMRLMFSVWWAEKFARAVVLPFGRLFRRKGKTGGSKAAGTNAVGGGGSSSGRIS